MRTIRGNNNMKRILALIFAALLTSSVMISCGESSEGPSPASTTAAQAEDIETEPEETRVPTGVPDDFNGEGYAYRILETGGDDSKYTDCWAESENGEILNDLIYRRNSTVEERMNIKINETHMGDYTVVANALKNSVLAAEDAYDLFLNHMVNSASLAASGIFTPLNTLEYYDQSQPWWDSAVPSAFSIGGKLYLTNGDLNISGMLRTSCMVFNKNLFNDRGLEYPYQSVYDGKWTFDVLDSYLVGQNADLDGDGAMDPYKDFYGLTSWYLDSPFSFFYGAGCMMILKDADDMPYINVDMDKITAIYDKMYKIFITDESYFCTKMEDYSNAYDTFVQGRALFLECSPTHLMADKYREMEQDFGIIPIPKFDEIQEEYKSFLNGSIKMIGVPKTIQNPSLVSAVMTEMSAETYYSMTPQIYDIVVKTKNARDEQSADMVDLIIRNHIYDLAYANMESFPNLSGFYRDALAGKKTDVASKVAKAQTSEQKKLDKLIDKYLENNDL